MVRYRVYKTDEYEPYPWVYEAIEVDGCDYGSVRTQREAFELALSAIADVTETPRETME